MQISDFVANISSMGGLARTNRFSVNLTLPSYVLEQLGNNGNSAVLQTVVAFCDSAQLPGVSINTAQTRTFGEIREIPYETNYEPINLTFYVDGQFIVKQIFDAWCLGIQDWNTRKFRYYNKYATQIDLNVQDTEDKTKYKITLYEAYPKTVSAVSMSYDSKEVMKVNVTMMYKYWRSFTSAYLILPSDATILFPQNAPQWVSEAMQIPEQTIITPEGMSEYTGEVFIDP